jgi:hypothetical protein
MPVFRRRIEDKIQNAVAGRKTKGKLSRVAEQLNKEAKFMLDEDIDNDPVSRKIDGDPKTIGYFGFEAGDMPVEKLKQVLWEEIKLNPNPKVRKEKGKNAFTFNIKFPQRREVFSKSVLNLPWISKTWVEGVEEGLSGVERFAFMPSRGRSEFGLQLKGEVPNKITPLQDRDYINRIRKNFSENLSKAGLKTKGQL